MVFSQSPMTFPGLPAPWNILRSLEVFSLLDHLQRSSIKTTPVTPIPGASMVSLVHSLHIEEAFYDRLHFGEAFLYSVLPGPSRDKVFSVVLTYHHCEDNTPLVSGVQQMCYLHPETRKMIPISGGHMKNATQRELIRVHVLPVPVRHFRHSVRVAHSDTDSGSHVNQSHYLRFCMDAAAEAAKTGALDHFSGDLFGYKLQDADLLFQAECHAGDELNVYLWEDEIKRNRLHFQIRKKTRDVLFSTVTFYQIIKSKL